MSSIVNGTKPRDRIKSVYVNFLVGCGYVIPIVIILFSYGQILYQLLMNKSIRYGLILTVEDLNRWHPLSSKSVLWHYIGLLKHKQNCDKASSMQYSNTDIIFYCLLDPVSICTRQVFRMITKSKFCSVFPSEANWKRRIPIVTLVYLNSAFNPILYTLLSQSFR